MKRKTKLTCPLELINTVPLKNKDRVLARQFTIPPQKNKLRKIFGGNNINIVSCYITHVPMVDRICR